MAASICKNEGGGSEGREGGGGISGGGAGTLLIDVAVMQISNSSFKSFIGSVKSMWLGEGLSVWYEAFPLRCSSATHSRSCLLSSSTISICDFDFKSIVVIAFCTIRRECSINRS